MSGVDIGGLPRGSGMAQYPGHTDSLMQGRMIPAFVGPPPYAMPHSLHNMQVLTPHPSPHTPQTSPFALARGPRPRSPVLINASRGFHPLCDLSIRKQLE